MKRIVFIGEWRIKSGSATNKLSFHFELLFENGQFNWNEVVWAVCRPRHNPKVLLLVWRRVSEWTEWRKTESLMNEVNERKGRRPRRREPINPIFSSQFVFLALKENKWKKSGLMASGAATKSIHKTSFLLALKEKWKVLLELICWMSKKLL